jgi:uncharacterized protein (TIGR02246 family)
MPTSQNPETESPEDIPAAFVAAWNARDPERLASLFSEDAEFVNVVGLWWHNREAIRRAHAYGLETIFRDSTLRIERTKVRYLSDDVAVVHTRMRLSGQTPVSDVKAPKPRRNIFSFVAQRTPEGWTCVSAHNTDVVPGAETNVIDSEGRMRSVSYR